MAGQTAGRFQKDLQERADEQGYALKQPALVRRGDPTKSVYGVTRFVPGGRGAILRVWTLVFDSVRAASEPPQQVCCAAMELRVPANPVAVLSTSDIQTIQGRGLQVPLFPYGQKTETIRRQSKIDSRMRNKTWLKLLTRLRLRPTRCTR